MILILSSAADHSTSKVIDWLIHYGLSYHRVNGEGCFLSCSLALGSRGQLDIRLRDAEGRLFRLDDYQAYWYRRGDFYPAMPKIERFKRPVFGMLRKEWEKISETIHFYLEQRPHLGEIKQEKYHNKVIALLAAAEAGLAIPPTLITTEKEELRLFVEKNSSVTKAVWNLFRIHTSRFFRAVGTQLVTRENIGRLGETFAPALVQQEIPKAYEVRVFFLKGGCYAMAVFSQNDPQTRVDFRNYNTESPNRGVPYLLPEETERKLMRFMKKMELDTGSVDLIVTPENEFCFLEVNPVGQFGWLSDNCNYYLEEKIALYLKKTGL